MRSIYCGDVGAKEEGQEVTVAGWVHRRRDHGGVIFIDLRDREGIHQLKKPKLGKLPSTFANKAKQLSIGSAEA